jgi:hypothetical protein
VLLHRYNHKSIYATAKEHNKKEMSPESSSRNTREKQVKIESKIASSLSVISKETTRKEADKPLFLLRYDD